MSQQRNGRPRRQAASSMRPAREAAAGVQPGRAAIPVGKGGGAGGAKAGWRRRGGDERLSGLVVGGG